MGVTPTRAAAQPPYLLGHAAPVPAGELRILFL
jgi:hypothetical protein